MSAVRGPVEGRLLMRSIPCEGLTLEPQAAAHAEQMFAVLCDPAIYEYENQPPPSLQWLRERYEKLESRRSPDGAQQWLNWVIRLPDGALAGYVQATVHPDGRAAIAYELASAYWGRGLARRAVEAMIVELARNHGVRSLEAVLQQANHRSRRLLVRLGFSIVTHEPRIRGLEPGEILMERAPAIDVRAQGQ